MDWADCKDGLIWLAVVLGTLCVYATILGWKYGHDRIYHDFMNRKVISLRFLDPNCCSWWPISHFIVFAVAAALSPNAWWLFFIIGVIWELIEESMGCIVTVRRRRKAVKAGKEPDMEYDDHWWAGSAKDLVFNALGIGVGVAIIFLFLLQ
jgi:hypothetical protein